MIKDQELTITQEMNLSRALVDSGVKECKHGFVVMGMCVECGEEVK